MARQDQLKAGAGQSDEPPSYSDAVQAGSSSRLSAQPSPGLLSPGLGSPGLSSPIISSPGPSPQMPAIAAPHGIPQQFPPQFNLYQRNFSRLFTIGEHQNQPLYGMYLHSGFSGQPNVVLHSGPSEAHPPLATADFHSFSSHISITMPPLHGSGQTSTEIDMVSQSGFFSRAFTFPIEVGGAGRREAFEWRHSFGTAVQDMGHSRGGWKLVRMETGPPDGSIPGMAFVGGGYTTSDGKEVVAVWSDVHYAGHKVASFRFLGTGSSGLLGQRWEVMAVITALAIWERERRRKQNTPR